MCCFKLRLFTRERRQSSIDFHHADQPADPNDDLDHEEAEKESLKWTVEWTVSGLATARPVAPAEAGKESLEWTASGLTMARPAVSRVLRVEPLSHTVMTSPGWRTLLITWNDHMQSWIKTGIHYYCH